MATYDPRKVIVAYNGAPLSGFGTGTFIKATRRKALAKLEELGADGEGAFVLSGDQSYDIELTLKRASPANRLLSQFAASTALGAPIVAAFTITDLSGGARFVAEEVMLTESPPFERAGGEALGENVWKFQAKRGTEYQPGLT